MKNTKTKEKSIVVLLLVAVLLMTVGFAAYTQILKINGTVTVSAQSWDIHYDTSYGTDGISTTAGSKTATAATITNDTGDKENTKFNFSVTLDQPGDYYEATIKPKNFGTIDGVLNTITMSSLNTAQAKYLTYTITYEGTTYSTTTTGLSVALAHGNSHTAVIRVEYVQPTDAADLPSTPQTVDVSGSFTYNQVQS